MRYLTSVRAHSRDIKNEQLTKQEMIAGCDLLMDSGADSCVAGKHAWVVEIVEGVTVSAQGFNDSMPIDESLPIANVLYTYDHPGTGEVIILCINHCIYLGDKKIDSIACPNQM